MKKVLEFFAENNGQLSNMRLNCTMLIWCGAFCLVFAVVCQKLDAMNLAYGSFMITSGLTGKSIAKAQENKTPESKSVDEVTQ